MYQSGDNLLSFKTTSLTKVQGVRAKLLEVKSKCPLVAGSVQQDSLTASTKQVSGECRFILQ